MSVAKKPRPPSKPKTKSAKREGIVPAAVEAKAARAKAALEKKAAKEKSDNDKAAAKAKAAAEKAARVAEEKNAKAAADKAANAKVAEEKKTKAAANKAANAKATEEKKARAAEEKKTKAAADKAANAKAAEEKKAKAAEAKAKIAADKAANAAAKRTSPKPKTQRGKIPTDPSPEPITLDSIEEQIREAYLRETRGALKERVFLKDLRSKVGVQSDDFDQALLAMQRQGKVVLMGLDNPMERTPEVEAAAVYIAGHARYLVYFQG